MISARKARAESVLHQRRSAIAFFLVLGLLIICHGSNASVSPAPLLVHSDSAQLDMQDSVCGAASSFSAVAVNSTVLNSDTRIFRTNFDAANGSGDVVALAWNGGLSSPLWSAARQLVMQNYNSGRQILTYSNAHARGIPFRWNSLDTVQQAALGIDPQSGEADVYGEGRLDWLRGDASMERRTGGEFRDRLGPFASPYVLGDIVDSSPYYVPAVPDSGYPDGMESIAYSSFVSAIRMTGYGVGRLPMLYVGSNDGMLHGFDASTGREVFAYVPGQLFPDLYQLTSPSYHHQWYVDGSPSIADVFYHGAWHSVLVGGLAGGGSGFFALDVTDPALIAESTAGTTVLWEFSEHQDPDLGYAYSTPHIVKMHNGKWAAVVGNGYYDERRLTNGASGQAVLYVLDIQTGAIIKKLSTNVSLGASRNGLSTPATVDVDGDFLTDLVYAGDLYGNVWKFDVRDPDPARWSVSFSGQPLFAARDAANHAQPITVAPEVGRHQGGRQGLMVYFGSGKLFETGDDASTEPQSFYGIWDPDTNPTLAPALNVGDRAMLDVVDGYPRASTIAPVEDHGASRAQLLRQCVVNSSIQCADAIFSSASGSQYRLVSDNPIDWRIHRGWYIDLPARGERAIHDPLLLAGHILFTSTIPSADACQSGGSGWLMEVSSNNGGRLRDGPFDTDLSGKIDASDSFTLDDLQVSASGKQSGAGVIQRPVILSKPGSGIEYELSNGSKANAVDAIGRAKPSFPSGRMSWAQRL